MTKRRMLPPLQPQCASWSWAVARCLSLTICYQISHQKMKIPKFSFQYCFPVTYVDILWRVLPASLSRRCLHSRARQQRDGVCLLFSSAITLAIAVAAIALDVLTLFNFFTR
jgi:hypothetical protein